VVWPASRQECFQLLLLAPRVLQVAHRQPQPVTAVPCALRLLLLHALLPPLVSMPGVDAVKLGVLRPAALAASGASKMLRTLLRPLL
jgi:hypothetical protein